MGIDGEEALFLERKGYMASAGAYFYLPVGQDGKPIASWRPVNLPKELVHLKK